MAVMYATPSELASYLQQDLDTSSATLALQVTSQMFTARADTAFTAVTVTFQCRGFGQCELYLPFRPVTAVSAVRVAGVAVTDYTRIKSTLYRLGGFGSAGQFPPDLVEVDLTHGISPTPDDVKGAILESAGAAYMGPDITVSSESIDDYSVKSSTDGGGVSLSKSAAALADLYRGTFAV